MKQEEFVTISKERYRELLKIEAFGTAFVETEDDTYFDYSERLEKEYTKIDNKLDNLEEIN